MEGASQPAIEERQGLVRVGQQVGDVASILLEKSNIMRAGNTTVTPAAVAAGAESRRADEDLT